MNYQENLRALAQLLGDAAYEEDPDFTAILPQAISFAENLILRDLDLLSTVVEDDSGTLTQNRRRFELPTEEGTFIVTEQLLPIVDGVQQAPLLPTSRETIDALFPAEQAPSNPSIPQFWAPLDQTSVLVAPPPDQNYRMLVRGTVRPASLNAKSDVGTFISTQLSDLFLAAEMVFLRGQWQKSAEGAATWAADYERRKTPALVEESRKKLAGQGWGSRLPSPISTPPQT